MNYSKIKTKKFFIPVICQDGTKIYSNGDFTYQKTRRYLHVLNRYCFTLLIYPNGKYGIRDGENMIIENIDLDALRKIVCRLKRYKKRHNIKTMHSKIDVLLKEVLRKNKFKDYKFYL